ncbi:MAG TPA: ABC transporter permease [Ilumatobacter sp.]|nr:ABC transporter permease [Ilumatobacter sp.]
MRTIQSEWIKIRTILSHKILVLGAFLFPFVIVTLAATFGGVDEGPDSLEMAEFVMGMSVVTSMLLGVVTAIGLTSEYTHNTIRPTYAATPARPKVLASKIVISTAIALVVAAVTVFATWFSGSTIFNSRGGDTSISDPKVMAVLVSAVVLSALVSWFGFGVGLLIRNSPTTVSLLLLWPLLIEGLMTVFLGLLGWDGASKYLPYQAAIAASTGTPESGDLGRPGGQILFACVGAALIGVGVWLDGRRDA